MAGFLGFGNYEKEGPGISKNAPKKKPFFAFFETYFRNAWRFVTLNTVYILCCIPILSVGLANAGITNVTRNIARDKHSFGLSDYFETIKKNWKQSLVVGILNLILTVLISYGSYFYYFHQSKNKAINFTDSLGFGICIFAAFVFTVMQYYMWTMLITFKLSIKNIYKNSFKFVFINLKKNFICFFSIILVYALFVGILLLISLVNFPLAVAVTVVLSICFLPAFRFLLIQFCTFPAIKKYMIDPYYEEHPNDDIELRKNLGLEVPGDEDEDEDSEE